MSKHPEPPEEDRKVWVDIAILSFVYVGFWILAVVLASALQ